MKRSNDKKQLELRREKVRVMNPEQLLQVVAGYGDPTRVGGACSGNYECHTGM